MKIVICRHGDPDYEHDSLTEKGRREAELLSERIAKLHVKAFYVSPLGRAKDTAQPTLNKMNAAAEELPWLHEFKGVVMSKGKITSCWDRKPSYWTKIDKYYSYDKWTDTPLMKFSNVKAEFEKVAKGVDALLEKHGYIHRRRYFEAVNSNHDTIVLFCHFAVEAVIISYLTGISPMPLWHHFVALPSSVTTLVTEEREKGIATFRCMEFASLSHLYSAGEEPAFAARFCECYEDDTRH